MSKTAKVAIGAAIVLVIGIIICGITFAALAKRGTKSDRINFVTTDFDIDDEFRSISIQSITNDIIFKTSSDDKCHVECLDYEQIEHDAYVDGDTLFITTDTEEDVDLGLDIFIFNTTSPKITIYLPDNTYEKLDISVVTGDVISDPGFTFGKIDIEATTGDVDINSLSCDGTFSLDIMTGDINLNNVECGELVYNGTTGDIDFVNVISEGDINIELVTGDINLNGCDGANIYVECTTGDVDMIFLSDKEFDVDVTTGDSDYPRSGEGGVCRVDVLTGDVDIRIA